MEACRPCRRDETLMTILADEPPEWIQPVRHTLGAALLRAGRPDVAEEVYREDLVRYPGNGWALFGVARSFDQQGNRRNAREAWERFRKAWASTDTKLDSTCFCQAGI